MDQKTLYIKLFDQHRDKLINHDTPRYEHNEDLDLSFLLVDMKIGQDICSTLFVHNTGPQPYKVFVYDKEIQPIQYAQTAYPECKLYTFAHISRKDLIDILVIPGKS